MASISVSFTAGMMGATMTTVGMPAAESISSAASRFGGVAARGSMARDSFGSSVVTDSATFTSPRSAIDVRMSMSRSHQRRLGDDADGVVEVAQHLEHAARVMRRLRSIGW